MTDAKEAPIRVFVSYSWTTPDYEQRILEIAIRLRDDGVDVVLDKWDLKEGDDAHAFMERMVTDATIEKAIIFSDAEYARKADARERGVGTETQIVSKDVYGKVKQNKFIPVIMERIDGKAQLPTYLGSRKYIDFSTQQAYLENYDQLLRAIYNKPLHVKPPLGKPPAHLDSPERIGKHLRPLVEEHASCLHRGNTIGAKLVFTRLLEGVSNALDSLIVTEVPAGHFLDELVREKVQAFIDYRDEYVDALFDFAAAHEGQAGYQVIRDFLELLLRKPVYQNPGHDAVKVAVFELLIYTFAVLIKIVRFAEAAFLLQSQYLIEPNGQLVSRRLFDFHFYPASLEKEWNQRGNRRRASVLADMVKERASHPKIQFLDLAQVEVLIYVRSAMEDGRWYPRLLIFTERTGVMELFVRARSKIVFDKVLPLLGASSKDDLSVRLKKYLQEHRMSFDSGFFDFSSDLLHHMDIENLGSLP